MDEALVLASVDLSRPYLVTDFDLKEVETGFEITLVRQFLEALSRSLEATIHLKQLSGGNTHHVIEAGFKALGRSLADALKPSDRVESTKGGRH
jgi:imidazoleglycerol-phosphate dehydratase